MTREHRDTAWRKSSYSSGLNSECVEVAFAPKAVAVRDSKNPAAGTLTFGRAQWRAFTSAAVGR
ncbi:DUF397 domain-containing protein [Amycolatopsis anabasis]|uniref:DUF397 domain-containing protein n=1 Tax=Amycolatopsis anabasis TaxID=1840409 RepID=UPI00131B4BC5|nr:DUF397 domain-containing protein [Amycolatopsis anabasis]